MSFAPSKLGAFINDAEQIWTIFYHPPLTPSVTHLFHRPYQDTVVLGVSRRLPTRRLRFQISLDHVLFIYLSRVGKTTHEQDKLGLKRWQLAAMNQRCAM